MNNTVESQNMSVQTIWNIRDARGINANEKAFLFVVASRGVMFSEWQTAAADMGMSKDTYYRTRNALIKKGLVKEGLRKDTTTVYRLEEKALAALVPVKEVSNDEIVWLEVEEPQTAQKPAEEPVAVVEVQEDPEPVVEAQTAVQEPEKTDEEVLAEDVFDEKPVKNVPVAKKSKKAQVAEKDNLVKNMLEERRGKNSFEDSFVASRIAESDNPEKAQALFDDEGFALKYTDKIQRAAQAAFEVQETKVHAL